MPLEDLLTKLASMLVTSYIVHLKRKCVWALVLCQPFFFCFLRVVFKENSHYLHTCCSFECSECMNGGWSQSLV